MTIKVCGINHFDSLKTIAGFRPDYVGFIFYQKSPRHFSLPTLPNLSKVKKTGVFVDAEMNDILNKQKALNLDAIQLHGHESVDYIFNLKTALSSDIEIFKAIAVAHEKDFEVIHTYEKHIDLFILDTKTPLKGGSGKQFNWDLLQFYDSKTPFLLSGGIGPKDAGKVLEIFNKYPNMTGVDINSKFEISPGWKSVDKVEKFIKTFKTENYV